MIIQYTARKYDAHQYFDSSIFTYVSDPTATITSIWSDASTNSALWYTVNPTSTVWDAGATSWDLDGNVYNTVWDDKDETYNSAGNCSTWNGGAVKWNVDGNVNTACWNDVQTIWVDV